MTSTISLLAAADFVKWLAALIRQPVEIVETAMWSGLVTGLALASLHLITMLVTRWGDRSIEWKSLIFSILVHLSLLFGLVAVNPPESISPARAEEPDIAHAERVIEVHANVADSDARVPLKGSGNQRVWEKLPDSPDQEFVRTTRSAAELKPTEGPERQAGPITAPDIEITDKSSLPDQPDVRPELKQTGEKSPMRVEAAIPLKIDDPTAESRPEVRVPAFSQIKRNAPAGPPSSSTNVTRQPGNNIASVDRTTPTFEPSGPIGLPDTAPVGPGSQAISPNGTAASGSPKSGSVSKGGGRAPSASVTDEPGSLASSSGTGASGGSPAMSPFNRLKTRTSRGQENGGSEKFHAERTPQAPDALPGAGAAVRDGIRTELPNDGLTPQPVRPNFDTTKLGKRTTVPPIYEGRNLGRRRDTARKYGGTDASEKTVEMSLRWLATHQDPAGFWDADGFDAQCPDGERCTGHAGLVERDDEGRSFAGKNSDSGLTALCLLAFLGAGYTHEEGQYADQIDRTLSWLVRQQRADGFLGGKATHYEQMYCHAMASYALAEAFGMQSDLSSDSRLREPLTRAVNYIVENQNPDGGWRYLKGQSSDMSIFGWQLMALKSAEIAGIFVPESTRTKMIQFLKDRSLGQNKGLAGYRLVGGQPLPPTDSMTAEALFCKQILGISRNNPSSTEAVDYMLQRLPRPSTHNLYYWYYGTLAMYQYGGAPWRQWNESLRDTLISEQRTRGHFAGSWDPKAPWGAYGGRIFSTAVSTLCLEVYYRFLPLYQMGGQYDDQDGK